MMTKIEIRIRQAVGNKTNRGVPASNRPDDVAKVQALLHQAIGQGELGWSDALPMGRIDDEHPDRDLTIRAIRAFQKKFMRGIRPSGRIDPTGPTLRRLNTLGVAQWFEQRPRYPVPANFIPPLGRPYKVKTGDSFVSLSQRSGLSAKYILEYNFKTTDSFEVNWYLRRRVGCTTRSPNQASWSFTNDADPGLIFFPQSHYPTSASDEYLVDNESFRISPMIHVLKQKSFYTCWAEAVAMMVAWKRRERVNTLDVLAEYGSNYVKLYREGRGIAAIGFPKLAKKIGMREVQSCPATEHGWIKMLRDWGPLMVIRHVRDQYSHIVIVTGVDIRTATGASDTKTAQVVFADPGSRQLKTKSADEFTQAMSGNLSGIWRI